MEELKTVLEQVGQVAELAGPIVCAASLIVSGTPTPRPDSVWGKLYRGLEFAALMFGKSKDTGRTHSANDLKLAKKTETLATDSAPKGSAGCEK
ncbi:MAG: hypothetical protein ACNI27_03700 [Desulfovibrio sp.]